MKKHPYQPMNAVEYFLYNIMVNTERLVELAQTQEAPKATRKRTVKKVEE